MKILVASIHHTGTKTIFNDLLRCYPEINQQNYDYPFTGKIRIHIDGAFIEDLRHWRLKADVIVPLRHPRTLAIGWKSRSKPLWQLEDQITLLKEEIAPFAPFYIPIDKDDRDDWLNKVNSGLKLHLTTDWPVIGKHGGDYLELDKSEERLVDSWMEDGFFTRFGYD